MLTDQQHPITPPPELVQQWLTEGHHQDYCSATNHAIAQAARWGADQELDACVEWLRNDPVTHEIVGREARYLDFDLYDDRRPKPLSLAEQALAQTNAILNDPNRALLTEVRETLELNRRALERLQELESNG